MVFPGRGAMSVAHTTQSHGLAPSRQVLANGVTVLSKSTSVTPAVTLNASIRAGAVADPPALTGVSHFVSKTIDRGTTTRSADQIAEELDGRGVSLAVTLTRQVLSLTCTCLVEDFEPVLARFADIIRNATFPASEVDSRRGEVITLIRQDEDNPAVVAVDGLMEMLYGPAHPYGRKLRGTIETAEHIDSEVLKNFHRARITPDSVSLALVGDIDAQRAVDAASASFGSWAAPATPGVEFPTVTAASSRRAHVIPMMNKSQADIAYGFISITRADPAYYAYWLMNHIMGQYSMGGRLGDSIRERQGMAYYVFSSLDANLAPGPLTIRVGVNPTNVVRAVESIDAELKGLVADGPTEQELLESKQYLIGSLPRNLETNAAIASFLQTAEFFGLGLDYDLRVPDLLRAVTRDEVHEAARRAVDPSKAAVVVAGPYDGSLS
jgi:zinc protease